MENYKKILLPVDGSENSKLAKKHAINIAKLMDAEILLAYVTGPIPGIVTGKAKEEAIKAQKEEADLLLSPYRDYLQANEVTFTEAVAHGYKPGDEICRIAEREGCDLIIMGSRGLNDFKGMVLGSVTHRVLSHCHHIPVFVVR
ncbi:universal stress protein [Desulfopila inferna]|uniref:universal stress protein n=1 Tax=Desulfopila inferna TaxID=468528 RepID=UPI00196628A3|nr:universal stress protein [Desulfopila inferna]MBM9605291.1 universal stress protein [Desulfopila inferna]